MRAFFEIVESVLDMQGKLLQTWRQGSVMLL